MNIKRPHLIAAAAGGVLLLGLVAFLAFRQGTPLAGDAGSAPATQEQSRTRQQVKTPQASVTTQQLTQNGLYTVDYKEFVSASLAERYNFIGDLLRPEESPDSPGYMLAPQLPERINVAEVTIPQKNLTLVAIYTNGSGFCAGKYCLFNLYVKRPDGYQNYMGLSATAKNYIMVDDKSVSLIVCSEYSPDYEQWRLEDGALEKPIPANSPGHFVPVGAFKHDKIAACP